MTTNEATTGSTEAKGERKLGATVDKAVRGITDLGKLWAAHGLNVGRSALETSATTLRSTANLLGEISEKFEREAKKDEASGKAS